MRISDHISEKMICLTLENITKDDVIRELAELLKESEDVTDFDMFLKDVFEREKLGATGIGNEIAIPHARTNAVDNIIIAFGRSSQGIDFNSPDNKPAKLVFLMGTPKKDINKYLQVLAYLTRLLKKESFRHQLLEAQNAGEIMNVIREIEN
ncbi:PTS sugar transporter subunit IIA [bacterium]|nr:PTS sugar transporter subunit IIA [bacterium]